MLETINGIDYRAEKPPTYVYVVLFAQLRAGRGVLKIITHRWVMAENMPMAISGAAALRPSLLDMYALADCFASEHEAIFNAQVKIDLIRAEERNKYRITAKRLAQARSELVKQATVATKYDAMVEPPTLRA